MKKLFNIFRNLFRRTRVERDLDAEVRSYADLLAMEKQSTGMSANDARRHARMSMGGPEQLKEEIRSARAGAWVESFWKDVRYAARVLRKNPGFTAVAILTLALGIGANTAVFSVVNAVILRPLPFKDSERLVTVKTSAQMLANLELGNSWVAYQQMHSNAPAFEELTAYRSSNFTLTSAGDPARVSALQIADGFFDLFGVGTEVGRLFIGNDYLPNQTRTAVLSDRMWRNHFGADSGIIGRTIVLNKAEYVVVGVASRGFAYPVRTDLWLPLILTDDLRQNAVNFDVEIIGRLARGSKIAQAQSQLDVIARQIAAANPPVKDGYGLRASTILSRRVGNVRSTYLMLFAASSFVLLIACSNLASFVLSRGAGRKREMAMRAALGASRGRLIRQALVENCLLGFFGGAAGAAFASFGVKAFKQIAPLSTPRLSEISVDPAMFWFAIGSSLAAGILFGIAPAIGAARSDPNSALKEGASSGFSVVGGSRQSKLGGLLVISEIAMAFVLLIGAVVTAEGFARLLNTNSGIRTDHLLTLRLPMIPAAGDNPHQVSDSMRAEIQELLGRLRAIPGVIDAAATDHEVLAGSLWVFTGYVISDVSVPNSPAARTAQGRYISADYFETLGIPLIRGRSFEEHDGPASEKVAIVNEALARQVWGTVDVVGKQFLMNGAATHQTLIVGVAANAREVDLNSAAEPEFYFSILQERPSALQLILRTAQDPSAIASIVSREIRSVDREQPIISMVTIENVISEHASGEKLNTALLIFFGAIGLSLALLGVYGVVAYTVSRRTREIGIRMALGANRIDVMRMVIRQGLVLAFIGVAIGAAGAVALRQVLQNNFTVANTNDVRTYLVAGVLVVFVACLACYVPARRAMKVDPMVALRYE